MNNPYEKVIIHYQFTPQGGLKIGSGHGKNGIIDNAYRVRRKADGSSYYPIPATSAKGRIRYNFKKYSHLFTGDSQITEDSIFGKPGQPGWARFSDLLPSNEESVFVGTSANTSIDRFRNTARNTSLRIEEYVEITDSDECYNGVVEGFRLKDDDKQDLAALLFAIKATDVVGADKTTGYGKGKTSFTKVLIGTEEMNPTELNRFIKEFL